MFVHLYSIYDVCYLAQQDTTGIFLAYVSVIKGMMNGGGRGQI
jgi:hypothetical protein